MPHVGLSRHRTASLQVADLFEVIILPFVHPSSNMLGEEAVTVRILLPRGTRHYFF